MIIFVISASDRESFNELPKLIEQKRQQSSINRPFVSLVFITKYRIFELKYSKKKN